MPNIQLSKFEILIMVIHCVIRFALSDVALEALLTLVNKILGVEIIPPTKYHFYSSRFLLIRKGLTFTSIVPYVYCILIKRKTVQIWKCAQLKDVKHQWM